MTKIPIEILQLAIDGGWSNWGAAPNKLPEEVALDREFWIALGKKLGWNKDPEKALQPIWIASDRNGDTITHLDDWENAALTFMSYLLSDQDPTEWWAQLTANK